MPSRRLPLVAVMAALALAAPSAAQRASAQNPAAEQPGAGTSVLDLDALPSARAVDVEKIPSWTRDDIKAFLASKTRLSSTPVHGTQVSFATASGQSYLWYPGNKVVLSGRWKAEDRTIEVRRGGEIVARKNQPRLCYDYGPNTYNPATGRGGGWECTNFLNLQFAGGETRPGDVFGLSRRKAVPFVLSKEPATIDSLKARLKTGAARQE